MVITPTQFIQASLNSVQVLSVWSLLTEHHTNIHVNHFWIGEGLPATELKIPNKEGKCEPLTQQVLGAVRVIVVVIGEMVDSVTAALIDACKRRKTK